MEAKKDYQKDLRNYPGQADDEVTQRVFYKSIAAVAPVLLAGFIVGTVALYGVYYGAAHTVTVDASLPAVSGPIISLTSMFLILLVAVFLVAAIWIWRNNFVVVTNEHMVDVDQTTLFHRSVSTLTLARIQDVSAEVKGPVQTVFQYGTIVVQTAGERSKFRFDYITNPYEAEKYILDIHKEYLARTEHKEEVEEAVEL